MNRRIKLLNIPIDTYNIDEAAVILENFIKHGQRPHCVFAANPEKNFSILSDRKLFDVFVNADLLIPDGIGMVLAARILKHQRISRVPGVELMDKICAIADNNGYEVFIFGAKEETNRKAVDALKLKYPRLKIVGRSNGYVKDDQMGALIDKINESKARILFLALGSPKQEKWFADYKGRLTDVRLCQGIGGSLDVLAGTVKRAPAWWRNHNLEWCYRLIKEPKRIMRQKVLPLFVIEVFLQKIFGKHLAQ